MAVLFPTLNNAFFPLPPDYPNLTKEGQRLARVNAVRLTGKPELDVTAWMFFRETYLVPKAETWYKTGFTASPITHARWVYDWHAHPLLIHVAPRGSSKTTVNMEDILRSVVAFPYWECVLFLSTQNFASDRLGRLMDQIEYNDLLIRDFGRLKCARGTGQWNRGSKMELSNGSKVWALPIKGASLGARPSGLIVLDDVEKSDEQVITPASLREHMREFFFNAVFPMSQSPGFQIPIRIIGTLLNRRLFLYWLSTTDDLRIKDYWKRTLLTITDMNWDAFDEAWQEKTKQIIGPAAYNAQYLNNPGTVADKMLSIHPELCTYYLDDEDGQALSDPFNSEAKVVTHQLRGWHKEDKDSEPIPLPQKVVRKWSDVVSGMRRFITVDPAFSTGPDSDYSVVHVMGFENSEDHRDTLYSLDIWWGRVRPEELTRIIYQLAVRWGVTLVGAEAYSLRSEYYERLTDDLPGMYGSGQFIPKIIPIKFPPSVSKAAKIMGLEWRFTQFRIKLPIDRHKRNKGYERLFWEIENATEDLALLDHDDCVDSLSMHLAIGKPHKATGPDVYLSKDPVKLLRDGILTHESTGLSVLSGMNASEIPEDVLGKMLYRRYDEAMEEAGITEEDLADRTALAWMGLPQSFFN